MRVIAGGLKNLKLLEVESGTIHPMGERVRSALFNILGERLKGAVVFDMCAGTGAVGIEVVSRGADRVVFVERDEKVLRILRENVRRAEERLKGSTSVGSGADTGRSEVMGKTAKMEIIRGDASVHLTFKEKCDIMVIDAPYEMYDTVKFLDGLMKNARAWVKTGGILVVSAPREMGEIAGFQPRDARKYAGAVINFYEKIK